MVMAQIGIGMANNKTLPKNSVHNQTCTCRSYFVANINDGWGNSVPSMAQLMMDTKA